MTCETWADHDFDGERVVALGCHPVRGNYQRVARTCARCGRVFEATRWITAENQQIVRGREGASYTTSA